MAAPPLPEEQSWDEVARTVAQAVVWHLPDATATQAEYHLVMQHLTGLLWRLGAAHLALRALGAVFRDTTAALRPYVVDTDPLADQPRRPRFSSGPATDRSSTPPPVPCPSVRGPAGHHRAHRMTRYPGFSEINRMRPTVDCTIRPTSHHPGWNTNCCGASP